MFVSFLLFELLLLPNSQLLGEDFVALSWATQGTQRCSEFLWEFEPK